MRRINYLVACMVAAMTFTTGFAVNAQQEVLLPDLFVRGLVMKSKSFVTVSILNKGKADADGCHLMLFGMDASGKKWSKMYSFDPVRERVTRQMTFSISPNSAGPGTSLLARIDSREGLAEVDETNNSRELLVPAEVPSDPPMKIELLKIVPPAPTPAPTPRPPVRIAPPSSPAPAEKILISPDIAATGISYEDGDVVATLKNVGDRDYYRKNVNIKDSFNRPVTLKRIVHVGGTSYTEDVGTTRSVPDLSVGKTYKYAFKPPKHVTGATKYIWILTIEGEDPNPKNNTFKQPQTFVKLD